MDLLKSAVHPGEIWDLLKFKFGGGKDLIMPKLDYEALSGGMKKCYELLNETSRSFAAVILALDDELRSATCIFYLVLRALDTVEDDMNIPVERKAVMLKEFHKHLYETDWSFMESSEKDKAVLEEFPVIAREFRQLSPMYQEVIADIALKMGVGMTVFLEDKVGSMSEWDEYCHYVAGLVGIGLSRLFAASGLESSEVGTDHQLANSMGLFLQKTNIIRDYLEDVVQGREFWPKEAWSQFAGKLTDFQYPQNCTQAVHCLNSLIANALQHVPDVLKYMSRIRNQSIFNFCAIPQTMAIATLATCYNNPNVFSGVVKIRKGQAVGLMMKSTNEGSLQAIFAQFTQEIVDKVDRYDPTAEMILDITKDIKELCKNSIEPKLNLPLATIATVLVIAFIIVEGYYYIH